VKARDVIGRHLGMFNDKMGVGLSEDLIARLERGRARNARLNQELEESRSTTLPAERLD
jgi:hypothetical protein